MRTAISHNTASATGSNKPSAGRSTRADPAFDAACDSSACSTPAVMETRDTARPSNAISRIPTRGTPPRGAHVISNPTHQLMSSPRKRGPITTASGIWVPAFAGTTARADQADCGSIRGRHVPIVDEVVDRLLDVDPGADHARLHQRR